MSDAAPGTRGRLELGPVPPARSRHGGRRSAVHATQDSVVVGTADGGLRAFDATAAFDDTGCEPRWRVTDDRDDAPVVTLATAGETIVVGERGPRGLIRGFDRANGDPVFSRATADDVGDPSRDSRFYRPYVVALESVGDCIYAAARRYERDGQDRAFESVVYALDPEGTVTWQHEAGASPIAIAADADRVAVAYNRRPDGGPGLVVLDPGTGDSRWTWDPPGDGQRRVGDVALAEDGLAVTSHADYRGYRLVDGAVAWGADLATPIDRDGERLYAYPNHVAVLDDSIVFVTGSTYPEEGRETDSLHPEEHTATAFDLKGRHRGAVDLGGFVGDLSAAGGALSVAVGQNFRTRDAAAHAVLTVDTTGTLTDEYTVEGVATAVSATDTACYAVEEPVAYHDESLTRGGYRLHHVR